MHLYVIEMFGRGGLIHYSYQLCQALRNAGLQTTLVTSRDYELADLPHNFEVVRLLDLWDPKTAGTTGIARARVRRAFRGVRYIVEWFRLLRFLRKRRPEAILFGEIRFAFEAHFLRALCSDGFTLADIVHDVQAYDLRRSSDAILVESGAHVARFGSLYRVFSALFVHSRSNCDLFVDLYQVPPERVHRIEHATSELMLQVPQQYSPDDLRKRLGIPFDRVLVTFFGTLTKYKGVEDLLRAFPMVSRTHEAQLLIAGFPAKDVHPGELKALARELDIADRVTWFLDYVPNEWVATLMTISDIVVLPYRAITQSGVLQIAFACGKPVVVTRTGGLPDIVEEGRSGLIAEPRNPVSLAKEINEMIDDPARARKMGARALEMAQTVYSWDTVARTIAEVLERVNENRIGVER